MKAALAALALMALAGCVSVPTGPSVMVLPGSGKSFDQFRADDYECRDYAHVQSGGRTANEVGNEAGVNTAAVGAVVGAAAGAAIGRSGHAAAAGAGIGTAGGALAGTGAAAHSARTVQGRYDIAFQQCMYAKGHQIPMSGGHRGHLGRSYRQATPPPPPPPAGTPPPPPPRQG
jgi:outer membrane lipoprotein SlyB